MKITKLILAIFLINVLAFGIIQAQFPEFKYHEIGRTGEMMLGQSSLNDIDQDGDLDLIAGASGSTVWWFEYKAADNWEMHELGYDALTDRGGVMMDVDGDKLPDQVSGGSWYKNPGKGTGLWDRYENGALIAYDNVAGDLNGDGALELVSVSPQDGLSVYFTGSKPQKKWQKVNLGNGVPGGIAPNGIGDIDGDGDMDIVCSEVWYDNLDGSGTKWSVHRTLGYINTLGKFARSSRVYVIDMDSDGDMDVIQCEANNPKSRLIWHENVDGKGINFYIHPVATVTDQDMHSLCVADFDNDGDLDIFTGGGPATEVPYKRSYIYENVENGEKWEPHEILLKIENTDAVAADVDGDGDIDICSKTWKDDLVYYLENQLK